MNHANDAAAAAGGGTVRFPRGTYACYSIHLKSNVLLHLEPGATIPAAETPMAGTASGGYDAAEADTGDNKFQDYGHNHWHNSLIWGEDLHKYPDPHMLGPELPAHGFYIRHARNLEFSNVEIAFEAPTNEARSLSTMSKAQISFA